MKLVTNRTQKFYEDTFKELGVIAIESLKSIMIDSGNRSAQLRASHVFSFEPFTFFTDLIRYKRFNWVLTQFRPLRLAR